MDRVHGFTFRSEPDRFVFAMFRHHLGDRDAVVAWAVAALMDGLESPSLATLAGFSSGDDRFEIDRTLELALDELGREPPNDPLWAWACWVAEALDSGRCSLDAALAELAAVGGHDDRLARFVDLAHAIDMLEMGEAPLSYLGLTVANREACVRWEASLLRASARGPLDVVEVGLPPNEDGESAHLRLGAPLSSEELRTQCATSPGPLPTPIQRLLERCRSIVLGRGRTVDLAGGVSRSLAGPLSSGRPILSCGDGAWVVDVTSDGAWGPVFYVSRKPAVVVLQSATLAEFLAELLRAELPDGSRAINEVTCEFLGWIAADRPGLLSVAAARRSEDTQLRDFAMSLPMNCEIADLRACRVGAGFAWAGPQGTVRRDGDALLFAIEARAGETLPEDPMSPEDPTSWLRRVVRRVFS